jgi:signal transduction histidine kinase
MTVISLPNSAPNTWQNVWNSLTQPSEQLNSGDKPRSRVLAALLIVFIPLALITDFFTPVLDLIQNKSVVLPDIGTFLGMVLLVAAYFFSRSRYYRVGGWLVVLVPIFPILALFTSAPTSIIPLFFLSLTVVIAGLLLSSRDTLIIGLISGVLPLLAPTIRLPNGLPSSDPNWTATMFILITTGLTVLVGRNRENNLKDLEKSQTDLAESLKDTEAARQRAERSDKVKSAFLASMSHELRTPLNGIINFTGFILDGDTGIINDEQRDLLTEVSGSGKHLLALINDVLDMSKIEAGSLTLFVDDNINLVKLLNSAISTCKRLTHENVTIFSDFDGTLPDIRADRQRVLQILLNVLSNACKFTEAGEIHIKACQEKDSILISAMDTGPGIAPEDQAMVFEAFKQTDTGLRQRGGTGLGMPISKSLVEAHGGRMWLESAPGKGSTFFVSLPIKSDKLTPYNLLPM